MPQGADSDVNSLSVTNDFLKFTLSANPIESSVLGISVFDLTDFSLLAPTISSTEAREFTEQGLIQLGGPAKGMTLVQCRHSAHQKLTLECLQNIGFQFRELTQHPILLRQSSIESYLSQFGSLFEFQEVQDQDKLNSLAKEYMNSFGIGRFHGDSKVSQETIAKRFHSWILSSHLGNNRKLISINDLSGNNVGIFLLRFENDGRIFWELTAIKNSLTSQGVAKQVFAFMTYRSLQIGHSIETNFSSENIELFKIYLDLGFRLRTPSMAMHLWLNQNNYREA